jgi:hypothetical protein
MPTCPSGMLYGDGSDGINGQQSTMYPGRACNACHASTQGPDTPPIFAAAGTVFATGKVVDDCLPPTSIDLTQAKVVLHDANGDHTLNVGIDGNFSSKSIVYPYTAKVTYMGKERAMATPQSNGDCNGCHTAAGTNTTPGAAPAPGRIALPQ